MGNGGCAGTIIGSLIFIGIFIALGDAIGWGWLILIILGGLLVLGIVGALVIGAAKFVIDTFIDLFR